MSDENSVRGDKTYFAIDSTESANVIGDSSNHPGHQKA